ncbi:MAG: insulinase family protein [Candidatus Melainabacteria bacterium]|nr:insulinase family protein [Candidatus Melainabacteria bacterium]
MRVKALATSLLIALSMQAPCISVRAEDKSDDATKAALTAAQSESWRKKPPEAPDPRPFKLPKIESFKLTNGLSVQLVEDHRYPLVTMALGLKVGSANDPAKKKGVAAMTADMLTQGTKKKTSKQIADEVDFIGGALRAGADNDFTILSSSVLSRYTDRLIASFEDVLFNPTFPQAEFDLKKTNLIQELAMKRSNPDFLLEERFAKVIFGDHPYSHIAPTPESVKSITRQDLEAFHKANYLPNESALVIIGDFDSAKVRPLISKDFSEQWKPGRIAHIDASGMPTRSEQRIYLVDRPGSVQSNIKIGNIAIKRTDPDYYALTLANQILGGAANSRLFLNLREAKSYTYGAYSGVSAQREPGAFGAEASVRTEVTAPSLQEFFYELSRIRNLKVSDKELNESKKYLTGSFQLGLETQGGLAQRLLEGQLYDLPRDYLETYTDKIMAVTRDDVRNAARKHIDLGHIAIAVVGDAKTIKPELQIFGPVDVYDVSGKVSSESKTDPNPGS